MAMDSFFEAAMDVQEKKKNFVGVYKTRHKNAKLKNVNQQANRMLYSFAANIVKNKKTFKRFEEAVFDYAVRTGVTVDTSFESYKKLGIDKVSKFPVPLNRFKKYYQSKYTRENKIAYVTQMANMIIAEHYNRIDRAKKIMEDLNNEGYNLGNVVPSSNLDINVFDINYDEKKGRVITLDEFIKLIKGEGQLLERTQREFYTNIQPKWFEMKKQKNINYSDTRLESFWTNINYGLNQLGWGNVSDLLGVMESIGISVNEIYLDVFANNDYDFIFESSDPTYEGDESDKNRLIRDLIDSIRKHGKMKDFNERMTNIKEMNKLQYDYINDSIVSAIADYVEF